MIKHHPNCSPNYPEKVPGEAPQQLHEERLEEGEVVRTCVDCGAYEVAQAPLLRGQLTDAARLEHYLLAGRATVTVRSKATGQHLTLKAGRKREHAGSPVAAGPVYFRAVYTTERGREDKYLGCLTARGWSEARTSAAHDVRLVRSAKWLAQHLGAGKLAEVLEQAEVWHEGTCGRCGRRLTVPESIETGFGPECAGKVQR